LAIVLSRDSTTHVPSRSLVVANCEDAHSGRASTACHGRERDVGNEGCRVFSLEPTH
jgi:hypothetical protein